MVTKPCVCGWPATSCLSAPLPSAPCPTGQAAVPVMRCPHLCSPVGFTPLVFGEVREQGGRGTGSHSGREVRDRRGWAGLVPQIATDHLLLSTRRGIPRCPWAQQVRGPPQLCSWDLRPDPRFPGFSAGGDGGWPVLLWEQASITEAEHPCVPPEPCLLLLLPQLRPTRLTHLLGARYAVGA